MSVAEFGMHTQTHHTREHDSKLPLYLPGVTTPESFGDFEVSGVVPVDTECLPVGLGYSGIIRDCYYKLSESSKKEQKLSLRWQGPHL